MKILYMKYFQQRIIRAVNYFHAVVKESTCCTARILMSLLKYFRRKQRVPDPNGSLSTSISPRAISLANCEVQEELRKDKNRKKRGPYTK